MKQAIKATAVLLALVSANAMAEITVCKMGETTRRVEVAHQDGDSSKPCDVKYYKDTEMPGAEAKVLWHYNVDVAKCKEQADGFIQKLSGMGYSCSAEGATQ